MESSRIALLSCFLAFLVSGCQGAAWSYTGATGVDNWASLFPAHCNGQQQSPIDLTSSVVMYDDSLAPFSFTGFDNVEGVSMNLLNNGHTAVVSYTSGTLQVSGGSLGSTYQVAQFHFHWGSDNTKGSEHTIDAVAYPLELHIVTFNTNYVNISNALKYSDGLAVLGFFYEISASENPTMAKIVDSLGSIQEAGMQTSLTPFALDNLMAGVSDYYRYQGGLTTPECDEIVTWTVFTNTIKISNAQMNAFRSLKDKDDAALVDNYRPVQPLNGRSIKASFMDDKFANASPALLFSATSLMLSLVLSLTSLQ